MSLSNSLATAASGLFATSASMTAFTPVGGFGPPLGAENTVYAVLRALYDTEAGE